MFEVHKLKLNYTDFDRSIQLLPALRRIEKTDVVYEIDCILKHRIQKGKTKYKVQ